MDTGYKAKVRHFFLVFKISISTFDFLSLDCLAEMSLPALENTLSLGTDVAGIPICLFVSLASLASHLSAVSTTSQDLRIC